MPCAFLRRVVARPGIIKGVTGAGAHKLIVVVAASGTKFHKDAAKVSSPSCLTLASGPLSAHTCETQLPARASRDHVLCLILRAMQATTGPVDVLVAGPGIKFDESLASATLAESLGSPVSTKTRVLRADESTGRIDPVDVLDGADHSAAHGSAAYPFQYGVLWLAQVSCRACSGRSSSFGFLLSHSPDDDPLMKSLHVTYRYRCTCAGREGDGLVRGGGRAAPLRIRRQAEPAGPLSRRRRSGDRDGSGLGGPGCGRGAARRDRQGGRHRPLGPGMASLLRQNPVSCVWTCRFDGKLRG